MDEALRQRQLAHIRAALAENARHHTDEEVQAAIERQHEYERREGRREPTQEELSLAA
jgi:hypothetical protein